MRASSEPRVPSRNFARGSCLTVARRVARRGRGSPCAGRAVAAPRAARRRTRARARPRTLRSSRRARRAAVRAARGTGCARSGARALRPTSRSRRAPSAPSPLSSFLSNRFTPSCAVLPIALLQRAEQRAVVALREPVLQLVERVVDLLARRRRLEEPRGAVVLGVPHDVVHADARDRELRADRRRRRRPARPCRRSAAAGPTASARRAARARLRRGSRAPAPVAVSSASTAGGSRRNSSSDVCAAPKRARERRCLVGAAVHDVKSRPRLRERDGRALRHRRHADECDAPRRALRCARATAARRSPPARRGLRRAFVSPRTRAAMRSASSNTSPKLGPQRPSSSARSWHVAHLADDLGLADAGRVETGRDQEQVLGRAFALPSAQAPLGFAVRGRAARQKLERSRPQVLDRRSLAAREDELDAIAGREVGELVQLQALRELAQLHGSDVLGKRELGERFAAALAPRDADHAQMLQHSRQSVRLGQPRFVTTMSRFRGRDRNRDGCL